MKARAFLASAILTLCPGLCLCTAAGQTVLQPQNMRKLAEVDPRFVSYNIEAVEITGGRFWKPYAESAAASNGAKGTAKTEQDQPAGMDANLFQYRAPIDLHNMKLRKLASALSPAFLRVSGTWRNSTYFQDDDQSAMQTPPDGYKGVMTRAEWKSVVDFSHYVHADIVTSLATSTGTRNPETVWTPDQAKAFFNYTKSIGGQIIATEFMNEPTYASVGGAPVGYNAEAFGRDVKVFEKFLRKESPDTILLGPGSIGEGVSLIPGAPPGAFPGFIHTDDMMKATGPIFDAFSYHFYATVSKRCAGKAAIASDVALSTEWLQRNITVEEYYGKIRDQFMPGKPMWLTETGEAGCGGDSWAGKFLDSFRFMDQLGSLAQKGVKTVMVNTLASSDYGLIDEETLEPRPNYWAALLWKRTMGARVLDTGGQIGPNIRVYAHCANGPNGAVALLILNLDKVAEGAVQIPLAGERYSLSAGDVLSKSVDLNGTRLHIAADGTLPKMNGQSFKSGTLRFEPLSITFVVFPKANNNSCM